MKLSFLLGTIEIIVGVVFLSTCVRFINNNDLFNVLKLGFGSLFFFALGFMNFFIYLEESLKEEIRKQG